MADMQPVKVIKDDASRVALELMHYIAAAEGQFPKGAQARDYYLNLYNQCWRVTKGNTP